MAPRRKKESPVDASKEPAVVEDEAPRRSRPGVSHITNKIKRQERYHQLLKQQGKEKSEIRKKRKRQAEALGSNAPPKRIPRTIDNTRDTDETTVDLDDEEVMEDEAADEFAAYFSGAMSKVLFTTDRTATNVSYRFINELLDIFPESEFYKRKDYNLKPLCRYAHARGFTDIITLNEDRGKPNGMLVIHLPHGPTAHFKLSGIVFRKAIKNFGKPSSHRPELILNNFNSRLGHTVGRMFAALFPQSPEFKGRRVVTFHNQRDFIFFRHHRYVFDTAEKARLQECGPRFTLKLKSLQKGTFDTQHGEYYWVHKTDMDTSRRRFFL